MASESIFDVREYAEKPCHLSAIPLWPDEVKVILRTLAHDDEITGMRVYLIIYFILLNKSCNIWPIPVKGIVSYLEVYNNKRVRCTFTRTQ